ncbi:MAG: nuclear transport factor 2 family protein [Candidatus Thorarchaeota archaeon]|nr:nuclear transport factor 2 family protein [Candidatus Thorarchaeota archaeon]
MNEVELFDFCREWLSAWTGNQPKKLIAFYSEDTLYIDPANRKGLHGHGELLPYLERLLTVYHDWRWVPVEIFPTERGTIVKWRCQIQVGQETLEEFGMDIVELDGDKITRNEVYFDRTRLMAAVERKKQIERLRV